MDFFLTKVFLSLFSACPKNTVLVKLVCCCRNRKQQHQLNCQVLLVLVLQKCHGLEYLTERGVSDCIDGIVPSAQLLDAVLAS